MRDDRSAAGRSKLAAAVDAALVLADASPRKVYHLPLDEERCLRRGRTTTRILPDSGEVL